MQRRSQRFPFPGLPRGWYVAALSRELRPGDVIARRYFDRELAIYRSQAGALRVADAFCPHMGAHLGRAGRVEGELLRCGFHGFRYDGAGRCVAMPYGGPPPRRAQLRFWEVREQNGLVLVWFDPLGRRPEWEIPVLDEEGWTGIRGRRFRIATHPQETTENSVDFGHFTQVHGFVDGSVTRDLSIDGPRLGMSYRVFRPLGVPGLPRYRMQVDYAVKVTGLGYSQVDIELGSFGRLVRAWVLPIPIDEENIDLVLGISTAKRLGPLAWPARALALKILCDEVKQDLDLWTHKAFVERPALAKGDGPVSEYRRWAKQFYAPEGAAPVLGAPRSA